MEGVNWANIGVLLRADLLCAAGHEEGIALFALNVLFAAIGIRKKIAFRDGCTLEEISRRML